MVVTNPFRLLVVLVILCGWQSMALAQGPGTTDQQSSAEIVDALKAATNLPSVIGRALQSPGEDWRQHLQVERDRLLEVMRSMGYLDAKLQMVVPPAATDPATATSVAELKVYVEQGALYRVGEIVVLAEGRDDLPLAEFDRLAAAAVGQVARASTVDSLTSNLVWELGRRGYPFARIVTVEILPRAGTADATVRLHLDSGAPATFEQIEFDGAGSEAVSQITALLPYHRGDLYSVEHLVAFRQAVAALPDSAFVRVDVQPGAADTFVLLVSMGKRGWVPPHSLEAAAGILLLLVTMFVLSRRQVLVAAAAPGTRIAIGGLNLAVIGLLLVSAVFVASRALSFL